MNALQVLKEFEVSGLYLFHGSNKGDIKILKPRQALSHGMPDGEPTVIASEFVEPAIFMSVLGSKKVGGWEPKGTATFGFYTDRQSWEKAQKEGWQGYVYVLPNETFAKYRGWEWRSRKPVLPVLIVKVGMEHLPKHIKVL